jgi:predicted CXXCH cytochrome family protein
MHALQRLLARRPHATLFLLVAASIAGVPLGAGTAAAGITRTPHNLIGAGRQTMTEEEQSVAVCAFCHTPQGTDQPRPLWQEAGFQDGASFATFDSFGLSNIENVDELGSVSVACVSCHDGVQALNVTLDGPVREIPGRSRGRVTSMLSVFVGGSVSEMAVSHPVGVPYGAWGKRNPYAVMSVAGPGVGGTLTPSASDQRAVGFRQPDRAVIDGATVWWLETGDEGRQRDDIHLYTRPAASGVEVPFVECASCHDPHAERVNFMREVGGTGLCMSCHAM